LFLISETKTRKNPALQLASLDRIRKAALKGEPNSQHKETITYPTSLPLVLLRVSLHHPNSFLPHTTQLFLPSPFFLSWLPDKWLLASF
jgi:hypothetical protein